jgi:hypothetical protein
LNNNNKFNGGVPWYMELSNPYPPKPTPVAKTANLATAPPLGALPPGGLGIFDAADEIN